MSDIQEEQKRLYKRAEENDYDNLLRKYNNLKTALDESQEVVISYKEENDRLNNIIDELTEKYINYMTKQDFAKKCNISRPYLDKLLKKMNRKEIYEFCKIRNKLKGDNK